MEPGTHFFSWGDPFTNCVHTLHSEGGGNNSGGEPFALCSLILHHYRPKEYRLKCLSDFPKLKTCVSEQAFPPSPCMCLL